MSVAIKVMTICRPEGIGASGRSSHYGVAAQPLVDMAPGGAGPKQKNDPAGSRASITVNRCAPNVDRGGRMSEPSSPAVIKPALSNSKAHNIPGIASIVFSLVLSGCTPPPSLPSPPMRIPFAVHQAGSKVETTFLIRKEVNYFFALEYLFPSDDLKLSERIRDLAGTGQSDASGRYINTGIPVYLKFKLVQINSDTGTEKILHDEELSEHPRRSWNHQSLDKRIAVIPLSTGYYRVSVENLRDVPELSDIAVNFKLKEFSRK